MPIPGLAPRRAAVRLLNAVQEDERLFSELLPGAVDWLAPEDRARATRLATSCLRWMDRADRILGPYLKVRPPMTVMNTLRLGVVEICVDKAAGHGVVNTAVDLVRQSKNTQRLSGLVNAVLRKVARDAPERWDALPDPQMPKWLRKPLIGDYGKACVKTIETAHARGAPLDLTIKSDPESWAKNLDGIVLPNGTVRLERSVQVSALPGYDDGQWWVQDAAAALPVQIMQPESGERVLDLCAAPGGKTLQLAAAGAQVTALDISRVRMDRVRQNLTRTRLNAEIVVADALKFHADQFDAILLDAPCSATGTIRRHPDLPYAKDGSSFPALFTQQSAMLAQALTLLKPGGRLIYCTCSMLLDEGEEQIKELLVRTPDISVDTDALQIQGVDPGWINPLGLRTRPDFWPEHGGMDGFFMTILRKPA